MSKSMYSLILSDEIIERIDSMAKLKNLSRSGLINQILAQYVSVVTPEQRMKAMYGMMQSHMQQLHDEFRFMLGQGERDFTAISALKYKYNPTIRYNIILDRDGEAGIGELRANLRTQNEVLLREYAEFIRIWNSIEMQLTGMEIHAQLKGGVYRRTIAKPRGDVSPERLSKAITDYISMFNSCVKLYLSGKNDIQTACGNITHLYADYIKGGILI